MSFQEMSQVVENDIASSSSVEEPGSIEDDEDVAPLHRSGAFAGKAPWSLADLADEAEGSEDEPDLASYFSKFGLDPSSQIAMCRTYANYLAALVRPKRYRKRGRVGE